MIFVDLTNRQALWQVLKKLGIPDKMLNVIVSFHEGMKAAVMFNGKSSASLNGTKQGCAVAPVLFALFFSVMLKYAFAAYKVVPSSSFERVVAYSFINHSKPEHCYAPAAFVIYFSLMILH